MSPMDTGMSLQRQYPFQVSIQAAMSPMDTDMSLQRQYPPHVSI